MKLCRYGVSEDGPAGFELVYVASDKRWGRWLILRGMRQEIEVRITKSGLLRVSKPRRAGWLRADSEPGA